MRAIHKKVDSYVDEDVYQWVLSEYNASDGKNINLYCNGQLVFVAWNDGRFKTFDKTLESMGLLNNDNLGDD